MHKPRRKTPAEHLLRLLARLPLPVTHALGSAIGTMLYLTNSKSRRVSEINIALCFPEMPAAEQRQLVKRSLQEGGKTLTEMGAMWLWPKEKLLAKIRAISGGEYLTQALADHRGALITSPHLGCWEMMGLYCGTQAPMTSLYRPPKLEALEELVRGGRERTGAQLVPTNAKGVRALLEAIKRGEQVGILPDQDPGANNGVFVPFFGISTNTMTLLSRLASKSGAPVLFTYAERLPRGQGYHLHFVPVPEAINSADQTVSATQLNATLEQCVRALPTQYQWSYKRFKTRPEGEPDLYQGC